MYNRYQGNSGRRERVDEPGAIRPVPSPPSPAPKRPAPVPLLGGSLSELVPKAIADLETEDVILLLILYLMYRESGDPELLVMLGAMALL